MFNKIWKDQIQKPKGGATIWQPKEKMKPDKPDDDCLRRLQRAVDEIRTQTMLFGLGQDIFYGEDGLTKPIDNETACKVLELFSSNPNPFNGSGGGITYKVKRPNKKPISAAIRRTITEYDGDIRGLFIIFIYGWGHILRVRVYGKYNVKTNIEKAVEQRLNNFWHLLARA